VLGKDFDFLKGSVEGPLQSYNYIMDAFGSHGLRIYLLSKFPFEANKTLMKECRKFDDYIKQLIIEAKNDKDNTEKGLVHLLVEANMESNEIYQNVGIFFLAGHETTSTTLQYILYNMAKNPDIQQKVRDEINAVFPEKKL